MLVKVIVLLFMFHCYLVLEENHIQNKPDYLMVVAEPRISFKFHNKQNVLTFCNPHRWSVLNLKTVTRQHTDYLV